MLCGCGLIRVIGRHPSSPLYLSMDAQIKNLKEEIDKTEDEQNEMKLANDLSKIDDAASQLEDKLDVLLSNLDTMLDTQASK